MTPIAELIADYQAKRLTLPGEMGERFQAIAFSRGVDDVLVGLRMFDLSRRL